MRRHRLKMVIAVVLLALSASACYLGRDSFLSSGWVIDGPDKKTDELDSDGEVQMQFSLRNVSSRPLRALGTSFC